jgi:hypothetical protein
MLCCLNRIGGFLSIATLVFIVMLFIGLFW